MGLNRIWKSFKKHPMPKTWGIYVVARFEGDKMLDFDTNWAFIEGYFGPNNLGGQENIQPTHWMTRKEYRAMLEGATRED